MRAARSVSAKSVVLRRPILLRAVISIGYDPSSGDGLAKKDGRQQTMPEDLSDLDHEAKRIKQWAEFLVVLFCTSTVFALLYWNLPVLVAIATIFGWGMWTLHKDAMLLDKAREAERRYQAWRDLQQQERQRYRTDREARRAR
jgi:hypothetical protein